MLVYTVGWYHHHFVHDSLKLHVHRPIFHENRQFTVPRFFRISKLIGDFCFCPIFEAIFRIEHDQFFADFLLSQPIKRWQKIMTAIEINTIVIYKIN